MIPGVEKRFSDYDHFKASKLACDSSMTKNKNLSREGSSAAIIDKSISNRLQKVREPANIKVSTNVKH